MSNHKYKIAVMVPTRGRTDALTKCVETLVERANHVDTIQFLFALDRDDDIGINHWKSVIDPFFKSKNVEAKALLFQSQGYEKIHVYYNTLAEKTDSDWLFVYNDDAIMETQGWDDVITANDGEFALLKIHTHNEHPYSIFPIYPREWYDLFGYLSVHQMTDAELSQIAYMMDLVKIIEVYATHDRFDLTGNNFLENTQQNRVQLEGNPSNPLDFHHPSQQQHRMRCALKIAEHLKTRGHDLTWWENVLAGKQDPWVKMRENDINHQMVHAVVRQQ